MFRKLRLAGTGYLEIQSAVLCRSQRPATCEPPALDTHPPLLEVRLNLGLLGRGALPIAARELLSGPLVNLLGVARVRSLIMGGPCGKLPRGGGPLCVLPGFTRSCLGGSCCLVREGFPQSWLFPL